MYILNIDRLGAFDEEFQCCMSNIENECVACQ